MGKVITSTGIAFNFQGTNVPTEGKIEFGTMAEPMFIGHVNTGGGTLIIESLDKSIQINIDAGTLVINGENLILNQFSTGITRWKGNGTIAELDSNGNLKLKGTIGTGVSF